MKKLLLVIILSSLATNVFAKNLRKDIDDKLAQCNKAAITTLDSVDCRSTAADEWEAELNNQYQLLLKGQSPEVQANLKNAQRAWIKYKNSYVSAMASFYRQEEGTVWTIIMAESKLNVIRDKAIDLYRLRTSTNLSGEGE